MFWFSQATLERLCTFPKPFGDSQKTKIKEYMDSYVDNFSSLFNFVKNNFVYILDKEIYYIESIVTTSAHKDRQIKKINNDCLIYDNLIYQDSKIINQKGAHSNVFLETIGDRQVIRKEAVKENDKLDLQEELEILTVLKNFSLDNIFLTYLSVGDNCYFMECASDTLDTYLNRNKGLSAKERYLIIYKICDGIKVLHGLGYLHRDLHPGNIFIFQKVSGELDIKIGDFGWGVKIENIKNERKRHYPGSRRPYQSPEQQVDLSNCSTLSDVYSLGKLVNFVMRGSPQNKYHEFADVSYKCCQDNPQKRYQSVSEMIDSIRVVGDNL